MENKAPAKEAPVKKERKKVNIVQIIIWAAILIVFLLLTNPSLIPFLPQEAKMKLKEAWVKTFGDVGKISQTISISWVSLFQVIAVILAVILIYKILSFVLGKINPKSGKGKSLVSLLRSALSYVLVIIAVIWCFSAIGVNISTIFASIGILALIIGFGAQSLVEDMVTGVFLVFEDEFNVGDIIEINGFRGTVTSIGIRTTCVKDPGGNIKILNNSDLRNVLNRSSSDSMAVTNVSIAYSSDIEYVEKVIAELMPKIREKYPEVFLADPRYLGVQELGDSGVVLKFVGQVDEKNVFSAPRIMNREIKIAFDRAGIEIPFTQVVVHQAE
nr:mechanosensitive ion channel family protein [Lachnospiraceae bacterium]